MLTQLKLDETHVYVNTAIIKSDPKSFTFKTIKEAVNTLPDGTPDRPVVLYLAPDVYWTNGTATAVGLVIEKNWLTMIGLGKAPEDTVIADARGHMVNCFPKDGGHSSPAHTMIVNGDGFHAQNLTIGNYLNLDLEYPLDSSKGRKKVTDVITQAYAIGSQGAYDCWQFDNCRIVGMLDTIDLRNKRMYLKDSLIEGTNDFLGGAEAAVYQSCEIIVHDAHPMYRAGEAATLFEDCHFDVRLNEPGTLWLTKFGGEIILDHCSFDGNLSSIEWAIEPHEDTICYFREVMLNGTPTAVSADLPQCSAAITSMMAAALSAENLLGGDDAWTPLGELKKMQLPANISIRTVSRLVCGEHAEVEISIRPKSAASPQIVLLDEAGESLLRAQEQQELMASSQEEEIDTIRFNTERCSNKQNVPNKNTSNIQKILNTKLFVSTQGAAKCSLHGGRIFVRGTNISKKKSTAVLKAVCNGVYGACFFDSMPVVTAQPQFAAAPAFIFKESLLSVNYSLDDEGDDCSELTWFRESDRRILAVSRKNHQCKAIQLTPSEIGSKIGLRIVPNTENSRGEREYTFFSRAVTYCDAPGRREINSKAGSAVIKTEIVIDDFSSFPTLPQPAKPGDFYIDAYCPIYGTDDVEHPAKWIAGERKDAWKYGRGINGAGACFGLITSARGAALQYRLKKSCVSLCLTALLCPEKETGEGFGSANGQYLELVLSTDASTHSGYALRIEREPSFAGGCAFSLRKLKLGEGRRISERIMSSAFVTPCTVTVSARDGRLVAEASTGCSIQPVEARKKHIPKSIHLEADIGTESYDAVWLHHTGTVPEGNRTVLNSLKIYYESPGQQP